MVTAKQRQEVLKALTKIDMPAREEILLDFIANSICHDCGRILEFDLEINLMDCSTCSD